MAFHNIKYPYSSKEWKTIDEERGLSLRHKNPEEGMNSQGFIDFIFQLGKSQIEFQGYPTFFSKSGKDFISWQLTTGLWVPLRSPYSEEQVKSYLEEAFAAYGFLYNNQEAALEKIEFVTKKLPKGAYVWH